MIASSDKDSVYSYRDYRKFLKDIIESYPSQGRGLRAKLARAIRCQIPFITHVLSGKNEFSPEQSEAAARFFNLSREASEYFILLVSHNRAATQELKETFGRMLDERAKKHLLLKSKLKIEDTLSATDQIKYYSTWIYSAVHIALTIPELRSVDALSFKLKISREATSEALSFLVQKGFVRDKFGELSVSRAMLHLEKGAASLMNHHSNWRHRAIDSLPNEKSTDIHYSGVVTLSNEEKAKVREIFAGSLKRAIDVISKSKEEKLCGVCVDFFEI